MEFAIFIAALVLFDVAAFKWGFDSRDGFRIHDQPPASPAEETN